MYKLAIFDMDGTLLDTLGDIANASNYALARMGYPIHDQRDYLDYIGHGPNVLLGRALPGEARAPETIERAKALFLEYYAAHAQDETRPYPGIVEMLRQLKDAGMTTAIYSNKPDVNVKRLAPIYFPGLFAVSVGFRDGVKPKPDPAAVFEMLEQCGVTQSEAAYIGDSGVDMTTGKNAGLSAIGVSWGFRPVKELWDTGADAVADTADELLKILLDKN